MCQSSEVYYTPLRRGSRHRSLVQLMVVMTQRSGGRTGDKDMGEPNEVLIRAVKKLALAGEQAGLSIEEMIELLDTGVSVDVLLKLICRRLDSEVNGTIQ